MTTCARKYGSFNVQISESVDGDAVCSTIAQLLELTDGSVLLHRLDDGETFLHLEGSWNVEKLVRDAYGKLPVTSDRLPVCDALAMASVVSASVHTIIETYPQSKVLLFDVPGEERGDWNLCAIPLARLGSRVGSLCIVTPPGVSVSSEDEAVLFGAVVQWLTRRLSQAS